MAVTTLKTAPSFVLLGRGSNPATVKWSKKDRLLFQAVLQLEDMKCPHCGVPAWHGQTADGRVDFDLQFSVCYGCQDKAEKLKHVDMKPGEWAHQHVVNVDGIPGDLPTLAEGMSNLAHPLYDVDSEGSAPKLDTVGSIGE